MEGKCYDDSSIMKRKKIVILFTCLGRRVSLLRSFQKASSRLGIESVIIGTDTDENSPALQCCDRKYLVKPVSHRDYAGEVVEIVRKEKADLLIPTIDLDLSIWARRRGKLEEMGCTALVSSPRVIGICQDKRETFRFLKKHGFDTANTISVDQALKLKRCRFPYFLKPWDGHASRSNRVVRDREELKFYSKRIPNCLIQDYINGDEHTVDVLVDFEGAKCIPA